MFLEDSVLISRQCSQIPCIRLDDMVFRPNNVVFHPEDENFPSGPSPMLRSFELLRLASVRTFQQYIRMPLSVRLAMDFFPKHRYGKIAAIIRTMWIPIRTRSSIRQVVHTKSRRPDASPHGPDTRATYMEIACIR